MPEMKEHAPGTFCWIELGTTDAEGAKRFYSELFGLSPVDHPMPGGGGVYTILQKDGKDIGGLYRQDPNQGVPPNWMSYVAVASADEAAGKAPALGGTVVMGPFDVPDVCRMAVMQDPTGATFAVFQRGGHSGAGIVGEPGSFCWNELATSETTTAGEFYSQLFGWTTQSQDMGEMGQYTTFFVAGMPMPVGGMYELAGPMAGMPPHWMVYFAVEDCDASADQARSLGAQVHVPPSDIPNIGRFSMLQDPQGAMFSIIKLIPPAS